MQHEDSIPSFDLDGRREAAELRSEDTARYTFACDELADEIRVGAFRAVEQLNAPYRLEARVEAVDDTTDLRELLGRSVRLAIERSATDRSFCGIVARVTVLHDEWIRQTGLIEIVPALSALRLTHQSRIFQEMSALDVLREVLTSALRPYGREADISQLSPGDFLVRDYCVQYQETDLDFVHRLMEEEGIGYYFEHDGVERLVLFRSRQNLSSVATNDGRTVRYEEVQRAVSATEPIIAFSPSVQLTPGRVTVRDFDWARGRPSIEASVAGEAPRWSTRCMSMVWDGTLGSQRTTRSSRAS